MAQAEAEYLPLLLRPDLIEEVNRKAAYYRTPEGRAKIAASIEALKNSPAEAELLRELEDFQDWDRLD